MMGPSIMHTVNMHEAKTQPSSLVQWVLNPEDVAIAKAGTPSVHREPFQEPGQARRPGWVRPRSVASRSPAS